MSIDERFIELSLCHLSNNFKDDEVISLSKLLSIAELSRYAEKTFGPKNYKIEYYGTEVKFIQADRNAVYNCKPVKLGVIC